MFNTIFYKKFPSNINVISESTGYLETNEENTTEESLCIKMKLSIKKEIIDTDEQNTGK